MKYAVSHALIEKVTLTTNAILLDHNDNYKKLIDLGIGCVCISTQGTSREAYEKVYGVKKYDEAMSGIRHLLEYNHAQGEPARIIIRFRNDQKPSEIIHAPDFMVHIKPFLSERVRVNFTVDFDNWGGTIKPEDMSGSMKMRRLPPQLDVPCQALFGYAVRHDGNVRLCGCRLVQNDLDDLVVGNIYQHTLSEIAAGENAWKIIQGFYAGQRPQTCRNCTLYRPVTRKWLAQRAVKK